MPLHRTERLPSRRWAAACASPLFAAGLWILLAGSVGVGLLIVLLHVLQVKYARPVVKSGMASAKSLMNSKRKLGGASGVKQVVA